MGQKPEPKQKTPKGHEIPVPSREDVERDLKKLVAPAREGEQAVRTKGSVVSIERLFHCDGPDCNRHVKTSRARPELFLTVSERGGPSLHFCGWDCVLRHAAAKEPEQAVAGPPLD